MRQPARRARREGALRELRVDFHHAVSGFQQPRRHATFIFAFSRGGRDEVGNRLRPRARARPAQGTTLMPSNQTRQIAIQVALAVLTAAVIAVEFLPTGASAQGRIIQSLRPSSHVLRVVCDRGGYNNCEDQCFKANCPSGNCINQLQTSSYNSCVRRVCYGYLAGC